VWNLKRSLKQEALRRDHKRDKSYLKNESAALREVQSFAPPTLREMTDHACKASRIHLG
jgi:hypothetical protein